MWARMAVGAGPSRVGFQRAARSRIPLLALAVLSLVAGLWGALARLGLPVAAPATVTASHGVLMTMGALGTVISLERAVALGRRWAYVPSILAAAGGAGSIAGVPGALWIVAGAGAAFAAVCARMWRLRPGLPVATMALGGIAWAAAALGLALGLSVARALPLVAAFLVLTVVGERVGLSKLAKPPRWSGVAFVVACATLASGAAVAAFDVQGTRVAGVGLLLLAAWLGLWDFAWRSVRRSGVTRYMAVALIAGYAWLAVGASIWIVWPDAPTLFAYDALVHSVFIGFVLSMIFAHELMIVPAIVGIALPFTRAFYAPLALLHLSLAARLAGDVAGDVTIWQWAGTANVVAIVVLAALTVASARRPPGLALAIRSEIPAAPASPRG